MSKKMKAIVLSSCLTTIGMASNGISYAQEAAVESESRQATITVTGSRGKPRSIEDSAVPIDVLSGEDLAAVPFTDANDILKTLVPSYSLSRQPISDGGTFIRPATLRGMPTDKTLVLVNNKRRHRAALVQIGGSGTQGPDIATIPAIALQSVEVLRDGAAAIYGSDAIAGVINFSLKENSEGGRISVDVGKYYKGDGFQRTFAGNAGFALGDAGFVSVSAELSKADATFRGEQYCESWFCLNPNDSRYSAPSDAFYDAAIAMANDVQGSDAVQPWGQPPSEARRLFVNAGYDFSDSARFYAFGNYSASEADGSFFYRYPGNGTIEDLRLADGSIYNPLEIFPGGFTPRFAGKVIDFSAVAGFEGEFAPGFSYDFSLRHGKNEIQYTLFNTINPSMGPDTPTYFNPGDLINEETQIQADFVKEFEIGLASPLAFAFGLSYLDEGYELVGGDVASYSAGPYALPDPYGFCAAGVPTAAGALVIANGSTLDCADDSDPVYQAVGVGSNGFPGYSPAFSGSYTRDSYAAYVELSTDITDKLFVTTAARFEDYSDFDNEVVGKIAARYAFSDAFAIRGSVGTGFRAPTPGQQGTTNVSTRLPNGFPVATGLFPALSGPAQALGASPLEPEKSTNYTFGVTGGLGGLGVTLDFYQIDLQDRVNAISTQNVSSDPTAGTAYDNYLALVAAGVAGAESIGGVFYFTNAFDTVTTGMDLVLTYALDSAAGTTNFTGSINYNKTEFDGDVDALFNAESQYDFENQDPEWRGVFTVNHDFGAWSLLGRANYYGDYSNANNSTLTTIQDFSGKVLFDLEASFDVDEYFTLAVGARNIFDEYPDAGTMGETCCGRIYRSDSIIDWQGGYYYLKATADF